MEDVKQWLSKLYHNGNLCPMYKRKLDMVNCKTDLFKIACDANGMSFIPELELDNVDIPYEMLYRTFKNHLNGKEKPTYQKDGDFIYNSSMYLNCDDKELLIDTTITCLLGYKGSISFPKNHYCTMYLSKDCDVSVNVDNTNRLRVYLYGGAKLNIIGNQSRVKVIKNE